MKLKNLIHLLQQFDNEPYLPVYLDKYRIESIGCWRGDYENLSLFVHNNNQVSVHTVGSLIQELQEAMGGECTYTGYKGGEYTMNPNSQVYADEYGSADGHEILGVKRTEDGIVIFSDNEVPALEHDYTIGVEFFFSAYSDDDAKSIVNTVVSDQVERMGIDYSIAKVKKKVII